MNRELNKGINPSRNTLNNLLINFNKDNRGRASRYAIAILAMVSMLCCCSGYFLEENYELSQQEHSSLRSPTLFTQIYALNTSGSDYNLACK